jgi:hypothetical protein
MKRQEIINNLKNELKTLDVENGGFVKKFFEWVINPQEIASYPVVVIRDTSDNVDSDEISGSSKHSLKIEIDLLIGNEEDLTTYLREKLQDILNVIRDLEEKTLIGDYVSFKSNDIEITYEEYLVGLGKIEIEISYYTGKWEI